jgi:hypothetical protein
VLGIFDIGSHELFVWGWLGTVIFLISASWVDRITVESPWHLAPLELLMLMKLGRVMCIQENDTWINSHLVSVKFCIFSKPQIPHLEKRGFDYISAGIGTNWSWLVTWKPQVFRNMSDSMCAKIVEYKCEITGALLHTFTNTWLRESWL